MYQSADLRSVMLGNESASQGRHPLVFGCVADSLRRRRVESALRSLSDVRWFADFSELVAALKGEVRRVHAAVFDVEDCRGAAGAGLARLLRESYAGIGLVVYRARDQLTDAQLCALGAAGVHDMLVDGVTDEGFTARSIILDSSRRGAADLVLGEIQKVMPERLLIVAECVVRDPANSTVAEISRHLDIHRQTIGGWCRRDNFFRAEEVIIWCRLLLVAALLELTNRTLESIAIELEYASPTALRNQVKRYTGMTATEIRASGLEAVLALFRGRIAQHRAGFGGQSRQEKEEVRVKLYAS